MKQILYCGSTSDGMEHYIEFEEGVNTGDVLNFTRPIGYGERNIEFATCGKRVNYIYEVSIDKGGCR